MKTDLNLITRTKLKTVASFAGERNLDVGCYCNSNPYLQGTDGYDLQLDTNPSENYIMVTNDKTKLKDNDYDTVTSSSVIEHVFDFNDYLGVIRRVLKKGGLFIFSTCNPHYIGDIIFDITGIGHTNPGHVHTFARYNIDCLMKIYGFEKVRVVNPGTCIPGIGFLPIPTVHILAQKYIYVYRLIDDRPMKGEEFYETKDKS